jgi:hypothetical protein
MSVSELDWLVSLFKHRGIAAWRRPLGDNECVLASVRPSELGMLSGLDRVSHSWEIEGSGWWVTIEWVYAGTYTSPLAVAEYVSSILIAPADEYEREISRLSTLNREVFGA